MKVAYFDCSSGAAGDMLLAAVLDVLGREYAAWSCETEEEQLACLSPWISQISRLIDSEPGGRFSLKSVSRSGQPAIKVDFFVNETHADLHHGPSRCASDIKDIIDTEHENGSLSLEAQRLALKALEILANAEAKVHDSEPDKVHFHEVGAFDSVMDMVGFAAAFSLLGVEKVYASHITTGSGTVNTAHGVLSVPTPAVIEILRCFDISSSNILIKGEFLTPTGAALLASVVDTWGTVPDFKKVLFEGCGAGKKEVQNMPNVVRLVVGEC